MICMYIHDYIHNYVYILYNYLSAAECVGGHQMDREKKQQMDGPGRIRARNHLLPRLLQNDPGALGGGVGGGGGFK